MGAEIILKLDNLSRLFSGLRLFYVSLVRLVDS
jgi:hypothetical protein